MIAVKAAQFHEYGGPEVLQLVDLPEPRSVPGEALVRVQRCGVNPIDRSSMSGRFGEQLKLPHTPGSEIVGTVVELGSDTTGPDEGTTVAVAMRLLCGRCRFCLAGDETSCLRQLPKTPPLQIVGVATDGGYAEFVNAPAQNLVPVPSGLDIDQATAAVVCGATAHHLLNRARVQAGERVLVVGASGGVGIFAMQLAVNRGAEVFAVTSGKRKHKGLQELNAQHLVERDGGTYSERVRDLTAGEGVDVVIDPLGSATFEESLACLGRKGRYVTCGVLTGGDVGFDLAPLYLNEQEIIGSTTASRSDLLAVLNQLAQGTLYCPIHASYPLEGAADALTTLDDPDRFGKVLLEVD